MAESVGYGFLILGVGLVLFAGMFLLVKQVATVDMAAFLSLLSSLCIVLTSPFWIVQMVFIMSASRSPSTLLRSCLCGWKSIQSGSLIVTTSCS